MPGALTGMYICLAVAWLAPGAGGFTGVPSAVMICAEHLLADIVDTLHPVFWRAGHVSLSWFAVQMDVAPIMAGAHRRLWYARLMAWRDGWVCCAAGV